MRGEEEEASLISSVGQPVWVVNLLLSPDGGSVGRAGGLHVPAVCTVPAAGSGSGSGSSPPPDAAAAVGRLERRAGRERGGSVPRRLPVPERAGGLLRPRAGRRPARPRHPHLLSVSTAAAGLSPPHRSLILSVKCLKHQARE